MAGWKSRGYVPDSDEEDESSNKSESQSQGHQNVSSQEGIDHAIEDARTPEQQPSRQPQNGSGEGGANITHDISAKKELPKLTLDLLSSSQETDELQEGHYRTSQTRSSQVAVVRDAPVSQVGPETPSINHSPPSSPLTLPTLTPTNRSTPISSQSRAEDNNDTTVESQDQRSRGDSSASERQQQTFDIPDEHDATRTRILRHRNPIQLHPYAIEHEKYCQVLQQRGVKPLRIAAGESQSAKAPLGDSQAGEFTTNADSQVLPPTGSPSSDTASLNSQGNLASHPRPMFENFNIEGGDLPDVDAILQCMPPPQVAFNGHKRRRVMRSVPKQIRSIEPKGRRREPSHVQDSVMSDVDQSLFDIPLSPPRSPIPRSSSLSRPNSRGFRFPLGVSPVASSSAATSSEPRQSEPRVLRGISPAALPTPMISAELSVQQASRGFRIPRGVSPIALPTPATSSEPRRQPDLYAKDFRSGEALSVSTSSESESETSVSEPEVVKHGQLQGVQRKIRGVLPASWLKLDLQAQAKNTKQKIRHRESRSPEKDPVEQRGVARPVAPRYNRASGTPIQILDSSSEADSEQGPGISTTIRHSPSPAPNTYQDTTLSGDDELPSPSDLCGDIAEDNRVDAMLPTITRKRETGRLSQGSKSKKKQTRLIEGHVQQQQRFVHGKPSILRSRRNYQSRLTEHYNKSRTPKFRPPDLSLLDVTPPNKHSDCPTPPFLRIAQRTVRARNDKGKSAPDRKYLRLATDLETRDANENLRSWREGTLKPRTTQRRPTTPIVPNTRDPLQPCTGNHRPVPRRERKDSLASRPNLTPNVNYRRQLPKQPRSRSIQTSLDHLTRLGSRNHEQTDPRASRHVQWNSVRKQALNGHVHAGHLLPSVRDPNQARPATLESLQANYDRDHSRSFFRRQLDSTIQYMASNAAANPLLSKFLGNDEISADITRHFEAAQIQRAASQDPGASCQRRRPRKRKPTQADIYIHRSSNGHSVESNDNNPPLQFGHVETTEAKTASLIGLGPFGTTYSTTLDVAPLPTGTYFAAGTFLGSGDFAKSFITDDLDRARGSFVIQNGQSTLRWGPWTDHVSTQMGSMLDQACENLQKSLRQNPEAFDLMLGNIIDLLGQVIRYFATSLSFYDAIDRVSFLQRCKGSLSCLIQELLSNSCDPQEPSGGTLSDIPRHRNLSVRALNLCTVLASQLQQISKHPVVPQPVQTDFKNLIEQSAAQTFKHAFTEQSGGFRQCRERVRKSSGNSVVLDIGHAAIESLVVASHLLAEDNSLNAFWNALRSTMLPPSLGSLNDARRLEDCWERLLLTLPFLEIDRQGVLEVGRRYRNSAENWTSVKQLLEPVFAACESTRTRQGSTINEYCRAVLGRCFRLINVWGWRKCESNIGVLFDFFARRNLSNLPNEETHGSTPFLAHLGQQPVLDLVPEDRCFHIVLKVIGCGLQQMRKVYPDKKVGGIIWRLLPNHGRFLPKDQAISQVDLDALRNHHDLLCTLYWASPQGFRPKPTVIQSLVDVKDSHKEACRINIRAWSNLAKYQLTTKETLTSLEPFITWSTDLLAQILRQHRYARIEAEERVRSAEAMEGYVVNKSLLESTIAQNQHHVEALLIDVLSAMQDVMNVASDIETARMLLLPGLTSAFNLFSIRSPQTNKVINHALEIILAFIEKVISHGQVAVSNDNDDSQDYGDWSAFSADILPVIPATPAIADHLEKHFQNPLRQLLSNCFGTDSPPEDSLLTKVIDTWVAVGRTLVHDGSRSWTDYIGGYGQDSWASLRDTEQTRKFSPYYLAVLIDTDSKIFSEHKTHVLKAWASSLMDRESLLKYQHRLTSSLLNANHHDPVLENPPFWKVGERFEISSSEFSQRRLSLISNMLSNMRRSVEDAMSSEAVNLKADYKELLKVMMSAMRSNYQDLGQGSNVRGAYVEFVHQIVELLQQHISTICPVDRFFTDSSSFPLPANDPSYVVGQLKNYGLRLHNHRTPKQLAIFIQSVSERAAVDGQQDYLADQLYAAMGSSAGQDSLAASALRSFLVTIIFPAYIDLALSTPCGWITAIPILQAARQVFASIMIHVNGANQTNVSSTYTMITSFLGCLRQSMHALADRPVLMEQPKILKTAAAYFAVIAAVLPALDYLCRISKNYRQAGLLVEFFESFALFAARTLLGATDTDTTDIDFIEESATTSEYTDVKSFTLHELRESLNINWTCHDEQYYVNRGQTRREVVIDIGLFEEERASVIKEIEHFINVLQRMRILKGSLKN
ncbi:MAG: hypothetical protein Q9166_000202 [cf. Caloplaca sp. 2 TL-2023]